MQHYRGDWQRKKQRHVNWARVVICALLLIVLVAGAVVGVMAVTKKGLFKNLASPTDAQSGQRGQISPTPSTETAAATIAVAATVLAAATPEPAASPAPHENININVRVIGDLMCHESNFVAAKKEDDRYDFLPFFEPMTQSLSQADLTIGNLEITIGDAPYQGYPGFRSPASYLDALKTVGFDVLTFANNHTFDTGSAGIARTIEEIGKRDMATTGAARTQEEADEILIVDVKGISIAIFAYTGLNNATLPNAYCVNQMKDRDFAKDFAAAREKGADVILVMAHWGTEYTKTIAGDQRGWAQAMVDAGADAILGSHPHVLQEAKWVARDGAQSGPARAYLVYSMGNFFSNQQEVPQDAGVIFDIAMSKDGETGETTLGEIGYVPTWVYRTGAPRNYDYRILPVGQFVQTRYEGMVDNKWNRLKGVWEEVGELYQDSGATRLAE